LKVAGLYNREEYGDAPFIASPAQIGVQVIFGKCVSPKEAEYQEVPRQELSNKSSVDNNC
jgi:hypothetical protein